MQLDRVNQHRVVGGSTALSGVLSLALLANPITDVLGVILLCSGLGYSLATQLLAGWTRDEEKRLNHKATAQEMRFESDRQKLKAELKAVKDERVAIATQIAEIEQRRDSYQAQLKAAFDAEVTKATQLLGAEAKTHIAGLETEYAEKVADADKRALARIKKHKSQHREHERQLHDRIAELEKTCVQHDEYLRAEFDKALANTDSVLEEEIIGIQAAKKQALAEIHERDLIIERLKGMVEANSAPRKFRGSSADDQIANRVIDLLLGAGIKVHGDNWDRKYHQLILWVESEAAVTLEIESQLERIQLVLGLYNRPTVALERGLYKLTLDTEAKGTATNKIKITNPPLSRLEAALDSSIHIRIVAPSGSGKTVLLGNLINYSANTYLDDFTLGDPKVTKPENWGNLIPTHYSRDCLPHYFGLAEIAMKRIDECADYAKRGEKHPGFEPQFHIMDELEFLYGLAEITDPKTYKPSLFKQNTKAMLKVAREHNMKMLFVTQSPLPVELNLRRDDLENCSSIFLSSAISKALNSASNDGLLRDVPNDLISKLKAEYKARLAEVNELKKGKSDDFTCPQEFIYLFFNPAKPHDVFMGLCPPPGHYSSAKNKTEIPQNREDSTAQPRTDSTGKVYIEQAIATRTAESSTTANITTSAPTVDLSALLAAGTQCPQCGSLCTSYAKKKPNGKGNVFPKCKNPDCETKTFKWKVI